MFNSGHSIEEIRRNTISGLKGWQSKVNRARAKIKPLHRSANQSYSIRRMKKLVGKSVEVNDTSRLVY